MLPIFGNIIKFLGLMVSEDRNQLITVVLTVS